MKKNESISRIPSELIRSVALVLASGSLVVKPRLGLKPRFVDVLSSASDEQAHEMLVPLLFAWLNYRPHSSLERYQEKIVRAIPMSDSRSCGCRRTLKVSPEFARGIVRLPMQECMKYFSVLRKSWASGTREEVLEMEMINLEKEIDNRLANEATERKENENE